jgi:hypothetical protein
VSNTPFCGTCQPPSQTSTNAGSTAEKRPLGKHWGKQGDELFRLGRVETSGEVRGTHGRASYGLVPPRPTPRRGKTRRKGFHEKHAPTGYFGHIPGLEVLASAALMALLRLGEFRLDHSPSLF